MSNDFNDMFKDLLSKIGSGLTGIVSYIDRRLFMMEINCLKSNDTEAVKGVLDNLVKKKNKLAIAPIYLAYKKHPNISVRELCEGALSKIDNIDRIKEITQDKDDKESMEALIKTYGNYRYDK